MKILSKLKYNNLMEYSKKYEEAEDMLGSMYDVILHPTKNVSVIKLNYEGVDAEAGLLVGLNHPYYNEIKELAMKGMAE